MKAFNSYQVPQAFKQHARPFNLKSRHELMETRVIRIKKKGGVILEGLGYKQFVGPNSGSYLEIGPIL